MTRRPALVLALLLAAAAGLAPTAAAAPPARCRVVAASSAASATAVRSHVVQLRSAPLRLTPAGGVRVVMWERCSPGVQPLELSVGVYQGALVGARTLHAGTDAMPVCDGARHRYVVTVPPPATGRFQPGTAQIEVYVASYDPVTQTDRDASDGTFAQLYQPRR